MNSLGDYHNLYVQSDTLILADVFEKFRDKNIEIYQIDPALIFFAPGLTWQICLKKSGTKLELWADVGMLLMVQKGIRGGICHAIHRYEKVNNRYMENYNKNKKSSYIQYLGKNNLHWWAMSQNVTCK